MPHHHVRRDAIGGEQSRERQVGGEHRWLCDRRLSERVVRRGNCTFVVWIDEDDLAERPAEERLHHIVGLTEGIGDDRLHLAELAEHVDVL